MKTEKEIIERIRLLEEEQRRATKRYNNKLKSLIDTLKWVLGEMDLEV